MKHLNDTYGHAAGDEAIRVVSGELINAAPSGGRTVRIGGDEFLIFASVDKDSTETDGFAAVIKARRKELENGEFYVLFTDLFCVW